jgi:hypothetical protein
MNHSPEAIEAAKGSTWDQDRDAEKRGWEGIDIGYAQHRDSDVIVRSNWVTIIEMLDKAFGTGDSCTCETLEKSVDWDIASLGHWAVGWVEFIIFNTARKDIKEFFVDIQKKLDDYLILDEMLYSDMEWEENHPNGEKECYCEDDDCPVKEAIMKQKHEDAYGDEHDENCPLCGIDS